MDTTVEGCILDDDGNALDPITYEIIPRERLIKIRTGDAIHCFDLDSLYRSMYASKDKKLINPYNRQPFTQAVEDRVNAYGRQVSYPYEVKYRLYTAGYRLYTAAELVPYFVRIGDFVVQLVVSTSRGARAGAYTKILAHDIKINDKSLTHELHTGRVSLTDEVSTILSRDTNNITFPLARVGRHREFLLALQRYTEGQLTEEQYDDNYYINQSATHLLRRIRNVPYEEEAEDPRRAAQMEAVFGNRVEPPASTSEADLLGTQGHPTRLNTVPAQREADWDAARREVRTAAAQRRAARQLSDAQQARTGVITELREEPTTPAARRQAVQDAGIQLHRRAYQAQREGIPLEDQPPDIRRINEVRARSLSSHGQRLLSMAAAQQAQRDNASDSESSEEEEATTISQDRRQLVNDRLLLLTRLIRRNELDEATFSSVETFMATLNL